MKTIIIIGTVLAVISTAVLGWAYLAHSSQAKGIEVSVLVDKTDTLLSLPDGDEIKALFQTGTHKWHSKRFSIQVISDVDYNPIFAESLPGRNPVLFNPYDRDTQNDTFGNNVRKHIRAMNAIPSGMAKSSIWVPLVREVNRLAQSAAYEKIIILYSNCLENSSVFSTYQQPDLLRNPDSVKHLLLQQAEPRNLTGVKVYIVFKPSITDIDAFRRMAGIFKDILEQAGAEVNITANLNAL